MSPGRVVPGLRVTHRDELGAPVAAVCERCGAVWRRDRRLHPSSAPFAAGLWAVTHPCGHLVEPEFGARRKVAA